MTERDLERFRSKVHARGADECWHWTGAHFSTGYPAFWLGQNNVGAHRVACELAHGPASTAGLLALHDCDNPGCVNPAHLRWGTPADNSRDMVARRRSLTGEQHPNAKLTASDVFYIRVRRCAGASLSALAREYGVTQQCVSQIVQGSNWKAAA